MKLSKVIAQKIVEQMMDVIPYNINVMDENGVIIGSGDAKRIDSRLNMQKFYHELSHRKAKYDNEYLERAKSYGLDLSKKCRAIHVEGNVESKSFKTFYKQYSHYSELENHRTAFFTMNSHKYSALIKDLRECTDIRKIGIGGEEHIAAISVEQAAAVLELGVKIKPSSKVYDYEELKFYLNLSYEHKDLLISLFSNLDKSGIKLELIQTLQVYIDENGDINNTAGRLNIHRNTLSYRLERIEQLTGKNPKILLELFELLCGLIWR